ncbi:MAG: AI-2E family transporter [Deltaproteobacteria bacterium]|nr:AI-2E family transporter [Deltaproteobacteria bacterium]
MPSGSRFLFTAAAFVVVVAGMRAAADLLVPFLLAVFISIICAPLLFWLKRKGIPNTLAVCSTLVVILFAGLILITFVGTSLQGFTDALPAYQDRLAEKTAGILGWLEGLGFDVSTKVLRDTVNPGKAMGFAANTLKGLSGVLTNVFMIILTLVFILFEASTLPRKIAAVLAGTEEDSLSRLGGFMESLNRYLAIKTFFSLLTGLVVGIWLAVLGVDYPILWGLLAFLLNYVPNIGSIIAAIPACLLALLQLGLGSALLAALGYLAANVAFGSFLEPRLLGRRLGLSTLVVWLSLVFWGWVLGPVGMLLSVPLTMIVKIALESKEDTRRIAILMGSGQAAAPLAGAGDEG